jgi:negative regulator of sigma-B (phosphoserine phosphatase)
MIGDLAQHTGVRVRPCFGQTVGGDTAIAVSLAGGVFLAIVDVLGHGHDAHVVANVAAACLREQASPDLLGALTCLHERLRGTLGAAAGLGFVDFDRGELRYVGIGNTAARRLGSGEERLVSREGIVGQRMRTPQEWSIRLRDDDLVLLYTDGVSDRFGVDDYPGLLVDEPAAVAASVVDRFGKHHDDAACLAFRYRR